MLGLKLWVCMGDQGAWLAQAKPQLAKKPLALPHPQRNFITLFDEGCQDFTVPQASLQAKVLWALSQRLLDFAQLALVEPPGATAVDNWFAESAHGTLLSLGEDWTWGTWNTR